MSDSINLSLWVTNVTTERYNISTEMYSIMKKRNLKG